MKNAIDKLLSLLERCSENSDEATRLQLIASITQSQDYKELSRAIALQKPFQEYYSLPVLETLDNNTLKKREELRQKLVSFHTQLIQCIHSGNGYELTSKDLPDFTSNKSIARLLGKISLSYKETNYTNIGERDALELFSDTTVRSAKECFQMLPISLTRRESISEEGILNCMGKTFFCIPIDEFEETRKRFLDFARKSEQIVKKEKIRRKKHALLKIATILLSFGAVFAFSQFGLFSESFTQTMYGVILIASIIFMIWG